MFVRGTAFPPLFNAPRPLAVVGGAAEEPFLALITKKAINISKITPPTVRPMIKPMLELVSTVVAVLELI
jgi:hypothetical protein